MAVAKKLKLTQIHIFYGTNEHTIYKEAIVKDVIQQAKRMAVIMAEESGILLKEILCIDSSFKALRFSSERRSFVFNSEMLSSCTSAPDIEPEEVSLAENVNITWRIE